MKAVIDDLKKGNFSFHTAVNKTPITIIGTYQRVLVNQGNEGPDSQKPSTVKINQGEIKEGDSIKFEEVPIVAPNGDTLIKSMSFEVSSFLRK